MINKWSDFHGLIGQTPWFPVMFHHISVGILRVTKVWTPEAPCRLHFAQDSNDRRSPQSAWQLRTHEFSQKIWWTPHSSKIFWLRSFTYPANICIHTHWNLNDVTEDPPKKSHKQLYPGLRRKNWRSGILEPAQLPGFGDVFGSGDRLPIKDFVDLLPILHHQPSTFNFHSCFQHTSLRS